jgi:4-amino-4-deoxy-L-arabinose transferase-like glycosyltransferase
MWIVAGQTWSYYIRTIPWFVWPAWPMAIWGLITWRAQWRQPHILLPLSVMVASLGYLAFGHPPSDSALLALIVPSVLLGAFGMPALQRGMANLIDWFALMAFSGFGILVWVFWMGMLVGAPQWVVGRMHVVLPGFVPSFSAIWFLVALVSTLLWAALVRWRIRSRPVMVWRSAVMSAGGLALIWALFMSLLMPAADYRKTYRYVASAVRQQVPEGACVLADHIDLSQRSSLHYLGPVLFGDACEWLLHYQDAGMDEPVLSPTEWTLVWKGNRAVDRKERFWLFRRVAVPVGPAPEPDAAVEEEPVPSVPR